MKNKKMVMALCVAMGIKCSIGMAANTVLIDTYGNYRPEDVNWGNNNVIVRDTGTSAFSNLMALSNCGLTRTYLGTGTLTLECSNDKNSDYNMLLIGSNSFFLPGEQFTVDMSKLKVQANSSVKGFLQGIKIDGNGHNGVHNAIKVTGDTEVDIVNSNNTGKAWGVSLNNTSNYAIVDGEFNKLDISVSALNSTSNSTVGIRLMTNFDGKTNLTVNDKANIISNAGGQAYGLQIGTNGLKGTNTVIFKQAANLEAIAGTTATGVYTAPIDYGVNLINYQDNAKISATGQSAYGLYNSSKTNGENNLSFAKEANIETKATGTTGMAIGVYSNAQTSSKNSYIFNNVANVKAIADNYYSYGIYFKGDGANSKNTAQFNNGISIETTANVESTGILANSINGASNIIDIAGKTYINADYITQAYGLGTTINVNQAGGGLVEGIGVLYAADQGIVNWRMDQENSFLNGLLASKTGGTINFKAIGKTTLNGFTGFSDNPGTGIINVDLQNGALWNFLASSDTTKLNLLNATVDMTADAGAYTVLTTNDLAGSNGTFIMNTDLSSETNGDKIVITGTSDGGNQYIQVNDNSLNTGVMVTGTKQLLLVTDASGKSVFTGKALDTGGLWDVNPTLEKIGNDWYLKKIIYTPSPSVENIVGSIDAGYGLWRSTLTDDTLRKRLGDLRKNDTEQGTWARIKAGRLGADSFDGDYQMYQIGYDKKNDNTIYGVAVDHSSAKNNFTTANGESSMTDISLYATNYKDSGVYNDLILRAGKVRGDMRSYGQFPDYFEHGVWTYSASYELGKTFRKDNGWFVEPEAQLVLGRMQGGNYTTNRGVKISNDATTSALGRLGFVLGRKLNNNSDYYVKANLWREFSGGGDMNFVYGAQKLNHESDRKDTWFELGLGGNVKIAKKTHVYGDVLKTFGADIQKKWQINAGVRWEF